jgi:hypothetical protein
MILGRSAATVACITNSRYTAVNQLKRIVIAFQ